MKSSIRVLLTSWLLGLAVLPSSAWAAGEQELAAIYDGIILPNAAESVRTCRALHDAVTRLPDNADSSLLRQDFTRLISSWKSVQTTYIAGDLSAQAIDYPRYIDVFHVGNEDLSRQMKRVLDGTSPPEKALFKNSFKTINALEYVLFADGKVTPRERLMAAAINKNICTYLDNIHQTYRSQRDNYLKNSEKSISLLLNALIDSSYKTREWRVGDPAGLSRKYAGSADARRAEHPGAKVSADAVRAVLATQQQMFAANRPDNFAYLSARLGAHKTVTAIQRVLAQAQQLARGIKEQDLADPHAMRPLFAVLGELLNAYHANLVASLNVEARILEADGD